MSGPHQIPQTASTRLRNCSNNTNIETIQCDSYVPKLRQRPPLTSVLGAPMPQLLKSVHTKPNRERSMSRSRCVPSVVSSLSPSGRCVTVPGANRVVRRDNSVNSVIRKEVYSSADNPALVEVTVKTHGNGSQTRPVKQQQQQSVRSTNVSGNRGEPWSKILQKNNVLSSIASDRSSFSNFDPLRTVHFLAQELQSKLQDNLNDDDHSIHQIISDMQQALNRVPPEVASTLGLSTSHYITNKLPSNTPTALNSGYNYDYPTRDDMRHERLLGVVKDNTTTYNTAERGCQTAKCRNMVLEPEKFQQHLEDSTAKIESACKQMEVVCSKLKTDKEELERNLHSERELVQKMRAQLEQTTMAQSATKERTDELETERNSLQRELQLLKLQQSGATSQGHLLQQLQAQKSTVDDQLAIYRQQLTIAKMETEKYVAILAARDKQVTEIRSEMNQLQELVIEQLREIQTAPGSSSATSCTTNTTSKPSSLSLLQPNHHHHHHHKLKNNGFAVADGVDRDIYKEIADAMANMAGTMYCNNGGDTTTTTTSIGGSGTSSTTTIAGSTLAIRDVRNSTTLTTAGGNDCGRQEPLLSNNQVIKEKKQKQTSQDSDIKSSVDVFEGVNMKSDNLVMCGRSSSNTNGQTMNSVEPRTVSIRDMFADIKKQAFLINGAHHPPPPSPTPT